jgi:hypothetical protein
MSFIPSSEVKANDKKNKKADTSAAPTSCIPTQESDYCAELDGRKIDFGPLVDKTFLVAVNTGDRNKPKLLASTMRGPFDFYEACEAIGSMYEREQHHAKCYVLEKSFEIGISFLDEGTIDYIEANWKEIVSTGILEQALFEDEEVIPAGIFNLEYNQENEKEKM